jgi:hypothetical protein
VDLGPRGADLFGPVLRLASLRHLRLSGWPVSCSSSLSAIGRHCHVLVRLDLDDCAVDDLVVQSLVFPEGVLRAGSVNLANDRSRTNPITKTLSVRIVYVKYT